ncbi:hypothetical protein [Anabaena azotica]|uniref:hypothetical protein n=1 Tax=Anabaena azotica TaxID=197653 RepID=UPI0039A53C40
MSTAYFLDDLITDLEISETSVISGGQQCEEDNIVSSTSRNIGRKAGEFCRPIVDGAKKLFGL